MRMLLVLLSVIVACGPPKSSDVQAAPIASQKSKVRSLLGKHANGTLVVAFLPDGKRAISSGVDNTARLWNISSGAELKRYSGAQFHFQSIALSPNDDFALTPAPDGSVNYWSIETGQMQRKFAGSAVGLGAVALSRDGSWAAAGGQDTAILLWNILPNSKSNAHRLDVDGPVLQLAFHDSSQSLSAVLGDGRVCEWTLERTKPTRCSTALSEPVGRAAFSADGHRALIGGRYGTLVLWDIDGCAEVRKLEGSQNDIVALAFSPGGGLALSGASDKTVRLWDLNTGRQVSSVQAPGDYVSSVAFSPDESSAIFGTSDGSVEIWQIK